jgi:hypothetical protein
MATSQHRPITMQEPEGSGGRTMRRTLIAALVSITLATGLPAAVSAAGNSPVDNENGHCHYVTTPHGRVEIDSVRWQATDHGLHQGATMSGVGQGPEHTMC